MLTKRPETGSDRGQEHSFHAAQRAAHHEQRRQYAAGSSRAERDRPDHGLHQQDAENGSARRRRLAAERRWCRSRRPALAGKSGRPIQRLLRRWPATTSSEWAISGRRPRRHTPRAVSNAESSAGKQSADHAAEQRFRADEYGMRGNREQRSQSEDVAARGAGRGAGQSNRNQAARLPLE